METTPRGNVRNQYLDKLAREFLFDEMVEQGFWPTNIDWVISGDYTGPGGFAVDNDRTQRFCYIELKCAPAYLSPGQRRHYEARIKKDKGDSILLVLFHRDLQEVNIKHDVTHAECWYWANGALHKRLYGDNAEYLNLCRWVGEEYLPDRFCPPCPPGLQPETAEQLIAPPPPPTLPLV